VLKKKKKTKKEKKRASKAMKPGPREELSFLKLSFLIGFMPWFQ